MCKTTFREELTATGVALLIVSPIAFASFWFGLRPLLEYDGILIPVWGYCVVAAVFVLAGAAIGMGPALPSWVPQKIRRFRKK